MLCLEDRIDFVRSVISANKGQMLLGYSGGKDSSAVLKLVFAALRGVKKITNPIKIVYCDTQVENPIIDAFVKRTLKALKSEIRKGKLSLEVNVVKPELHRGYFVRVIGRGYPPPTNSFRWCTNDLRIRPIKKILSEHAQSATVIVGTRLAESQQRDRTIRKYESADRNADGIPFFQKQKEANRFVDLFAPIVDLSTDQVWETLCELTEPYAIDVEALAKLYRDGGGECPTIRDFKDKPCSKARFGCWVCTVVRQDRSGQRLIEAGYDSLAPYFEFRKWLLDIRNVEHYRCKSRRNGSHGLGPFTLDARRMILSRLGELEKKTGTSLLSSAQREKIAQLWKQDKLSPEYRTMEA